MHAYLEACLQHVGKSGGSPRYIETHGQRRSFLLYIELTDLLFRTCEAVSRVGDRRIDPSRLGLQDADLHVIKPSRDRDSDALLKSPGYDDVV